MLKSTLTAILLSSVALVPAATVAVVATADVAHAKSDKAGGNGNGNLERRRRQIGKPQIGY